MSCILTITVMVSKAVTYQHFFFSEKLQMILSKHESSVLKLIYFTPSDAFSVIFMFSRTLY